MLATWRVHHARQAQLKKGFAYIQDQSDALALLGLAKGIAQSEIQDATNILVLERQMWSHFDGISGDIDVDFEDNDQNHISFAGDVSLHRIDRVFTDDTHIVGQYEMTISDKQSGWTATTDGTPENTTTTYKNQQVPEIVKAIVPSILHMMTFPHDMYLNLYRDNLNPRGVFTFSEMLKTWKVWRVLHSDGTPHSYTFFEDYSKYPDFTVANGHLSRWFECDRLGKYPYFKVVESLNLSFENPVQSNGIWYPTVIQIVPAPVPWPYPAMSEGFLDRARTLHPIPSEKSGKGRLRITLSNVSVKIR